MTIPFLDYKKVNAPYIEEILVATRRVLESGWYVLGAEVDAFEKECFMYLSRSKADEI